MTKKVNLRSGRLRQLLSVVLVFVLVGSISYLGVHLYNSSKAASPGTIYISPASGNWTAGSNVSVTVREESGTAAVNSAQFFLTYNPSQLSYQSLTEGDFNDPFMEDTDDPGVIRIQRGMRGSTLTGDKAIVTVNFKVLASSGSTALGIDQSNSILASGGNNILQTVAGGNYTIAQAVVQDAVLSLSPASGNYANGATVSVAVRLKSPSQRVFSVQSVVNYPANQLQYVNTTNTTGFPTDLRTVNTNGTIDLIRGVKGGTSGFQGDGVVATLNFKVIGSSGSIPLSFTNASRVYDGSAKNILGSTSNAAFTIPTPQNPNPPVTPPPPTGGTTPKPPTTSTKPPITSGSGSVTYAPGRGNVSIAGGGTQVQGTLDLTPVVDPEVLAENPGDSITKVEYYLSGKLVASITKPPFTYTVDTNKLANGSYDLEIKTFYKSGTVDKATDKLIVKNPVTFSYVMTNYGPGIIATLLGFAVVTFIAWKYLLPRFIGRQAPAMAGYEGYMGYDDGGSMQSAMPGYEAPNPSMITPTTVAPGADVYDPSQAAATQQTQPIDMVTPQAPQQLQQNQAAPLQPTPQAPQQQPVDPATTQNQDPQNPPQGPAQPPRQG